MKNPIRQDTARRPEVSDPPQVSDPTGELSHAPEQRPTVPADAILAAVLDPTVTIDQFGVIQSASRSVEAVLGYSPQELEGRNISMLMPEPHAGQHDEYLASYRRTGETHILGRTRQFEVIRKDGRHIDCDLSVARADSVGADGPIFIGSFRDVTERKAAERSLIESEARFRAIFDQEFQHVGLLSRDGTILEMNHTALKAIGASAADVRGKLFWQTPWWDYSPINQDRVRQAVLDAAYGKFVRFEVELRVPDGSLRAIDFSLKPIHDEDGHVHLLLPEGRDITELKRAQRAETAMLRTLAAIGENAAALTHEIKNPITAINIALRAVASELGEDDKTILEDLASRMQRLEGLMRQTLSFATPLSLELEPCPAREILETARRMLRESMAAADTEVTIDVLPESLTILCAKRELEDVLVNLLGNALEALESSGHIRMTANYHSSTEVCISVEDDGPGIPAEAKADLFKPFVSTKPEGTGLGLAICQKVVDAHRGRIVVDDSPLGGARFSIFLPC